jgi:hypothetical protein
MLPVSSFIFDKSGSYAVLLMILLLKEGRAMTCFMTFFHPAPPSTRIFKTMASYPTLSKMGVSYFQLAGCVEYVRLLQK